MARVALVAAHIPRPLGSRAASADRCGAAGDPSRAEPGPGALAREPRGTRIADPLRNMPMLVGLAPISGLSHPRSAGRRGVDAAGDGADERPPCSSRWSGGVAGDRDQVCGSSRPVENRIESRAAEDRAHRRDDRGSGAGQLALRRVVGGRAGRLGPEHSRSGGRRSRPVRAWLLPWTCDRRCRRCWTSGRAIPEEILAALRSRRAARGRVASTRGMDDLGPVRTNRAG